MTFSLRSLFLKPTVVVFIYVYRIDINTERLIFCSNKLCSTHTHITLIYINSFTKELKGKILVKIPDSVLDSALALSGKEGGLVRGKI